MTAPRLKRDGVDLCPEHDKRAAMDDGEFWEHVFNGYHRSNPRHDEHAFEIDPEEFDLMSSINSTCTECGGVGACGYETDGRAYIHVQQEAE